MSNSDSQCTYLIFHNYETPSIKELKDKLENGKDDAKVNIF
jgi:hypothetical protein